MHMYCTRMDVACMYSMYLRSQTCIYDGMCSDGMGMGMGIGRDGNAGVGERDMHIYVLYDARLASQQGTYSMCLCCGTLCVLYRDPYITQDTVYSRGRRGPFLPRSPRYR